MAMRLNPDTGMMEDDGAPAIDAPMGAPPPALASPTPGAEEPVAAADANTPGDTVLPPPNPAVPVVKGALPGLGVASQTLTAPSVTTTSKIITPDVQAADKDVATAVTERKKALEHEAKNLAEEARIKGAELSIEADRKEREANEARAAIEEATRRRAEVAAQAKHDQDALQAEAQRNHAGFFEDKGTEGGGKTSSKILWALSLAFGAGAVKYGQDSAGERLLDKAMGEWSQRRQLEVDRLGKVAASSGAAYQNFWANYGAEYQAQKTLKDAAGYADVASKIRQLVADRGALMTDQAKTAALEKAGAYDEKAAQDHQRAVDARLSTQAVHSGGQVTTLKAPTSDKVKNNNTDVYGPDGKPMVKAPTPVQAAAANKANASYAQLDGLLSALQKSYKEHGRYVWPFGTTSAERDANKAQAIVAFKNMAQLGQISAGDMTLINDAISGGATGEQAVSKLAEARTRFQKGHETFLATQGISPGPVAKAWKAADTEAPKTIPITPADQGLLTKAKATKPGDPLYDSSQKWLRAHGL